METNTFSLELLTNDNYADWSVKMKNKLLAQGLWDIIEIGLEPPKPDDDEVEYEVRRKMNDAALHAIQNSCGMDILSRINNISSSKTAWKVLGKIPMESNGHEKLIQTEDDNLIIDEGNSSSLDNPILTEDDNLIIDEGNSSSSDNPGPESGEDDCNIYASPLLEAVQSGNWNATREFLKDHPAALTASILTMGGTVLHAAVDAEQEHIVEELVNMISENDLKMQNFAGFTALHRTTFSGNHRMAECLIRKNKRLVSIRDQDDELPVALAMGCGHKELARYLYSQTPFDDLEAEEGSQGASLLNSCIYNRDLDMALELMERCPRLAFAVDGRDEMSPLEALAVSTEAFESGKGLVFWKQWIYNHCIHISLDRAADQFRLNIQNHGQEKNIGSVRADIWRQLVSSLSNLLGFKRLYEMKLVRAQFQRLLSLMCQEIQRNPYNHYIIMRVVFGAIKRGSFEFVYQMVKANPDLLWMAGDDHEKMSMFHRAVLHRQHKIFSLIYGLKNKNIPLSAIDKSRNTILHMAGMLTENTPIDQIRGAALQMQREVQWFQEVESICPPSHKEKLNKYDLTARQLFAKHHLLMRKEGERWMKDTATSCTVVGALIITIMFAAAFTIPGGNNQDTGLPILVHNKLFKLFIITDSLSLFSSSAAVLMFSGILTSRYAEEDFLRSLPKKMIIGLFALFFSIATMMIAFSTALLLMFREKYQIVVPIIGLASIPIILFVLMQSRLLIDMLVSTYGSGIFDRKIKPWL